MFEVGMPDAESFEPGSGGRLYPILEIKRAILAVGVRKACRDRPVRSQQLDDRCHSDSPKTSFHRQQARRYFASRSRGTAPISDRNANVSRICHTSTACPSRKR